MTDQLPPYTPSRETSSYNPATVPPPLPSYPASAHRSGSDLGPPSKTLATWALVLAIIPIPLGNLVAIGQAVQVLLRCRDGRDHGKGLAIAALVIAPLWLVAHIALIASALTGQADRDPGGAVTARGDVSVDSLMVGDCLPKVITERQVQRTIEVVPCSDVHWGEVYANFDLVKGPFPGNAQVERLADGGCSKRMERVEAEAPTGSTLEGFILYPVKETWNVDRGVTCIVVTEAPSTGSLRDTES